MVESIEDCEECGADITTDAYEEPSSSVMVKFCDACGHEQQTADY
jgi:hypothetical protein